MGVVYLISQYATDHIYIYIYIIYVCMYVRMYVFKELLNLFIEPFYVYVILPILHRTLFISDNNHSSSM